MIRLCQNDCLASENLIADDDPAISPIVLDCSDDLLNRMYANGRRMVLTLNYGDFSVPVQYQICAIIVCCGGLKNRNFPVFKHCLDIELKVQTYLLFHDLLHRLRENWSW